MKIEEVALLQLAIALKNKNYNITVSEIGLSEYNKILFLKEKIFTEDLEKLNPNTLVIVKNFQDNNPEVIKSQNLGLKIFSYPEFIYQLTKDKTRIVIAGFKGKNIITKLILHVMKFHQKNVDYIIQNSIKITDENDFIIIEDNENWLFTKEYHPNIALISNVISENNSIDLLQNFIKSITSGGILVYDEENEDVGNSIENSGNYFRKLPYKKPKHTIINDIINLETDFGSIPLKNFEKNNLQNIEGARLICSQIGILEEDFYDALLSFKI